MLFTFSAPIDGTWEVSSVVSGKTVSVQNQKRRIRKRAAIVPRVLKRDIRKLYSSMFANVFNIMDSELINSFFNTFCQGGSSFCFQISHSVRTDDVLQSDCAQSMCIDRTEIASLLMSTNCQRFPDMTMQISESMLHQSPHTGESHVTANFCIKGTKIYDTDSWEKLVFPPDEQEEEGDDHVNGTVMTAAVKRPLAAVTTTIGSNNAKAASNYEYSISSTSFSGKKGIQLCYSNEQHMELISTSPLLETPLKITTSGTITLYLNAHKRITKLEMVTTAMTLVEGCRT